MSLFQTILHPTDFDAPSQEAFRVARALGALTGARVISFHVASPPAVVTQDGRILQDPKDPNPKDLWEGYRKLAAQTPGPAVEYSLVVGDHKEAKKLLLNLIAQRGEGVLLVMGTQGRTGISRLLWGSVAEEMVREAPCPVLVVKAAKS
jgi:nucleotide-binding universal stress UspA family protein